jgi:hypothetical protein
MSRRLSSDESARLAEKLMELGNLTVAALGIGQVLSTNINIIAVVAGFVVQFGLYYAAIQIMKRG